jgi:hypothetical protein
MKAREAVSAHIARAPYAISGPWIQDTYGSQSRYTRVVRSHTRLIGVKLCVCVIHTYTHQRCARIINRGLHAPVHHIWHCLPYAKHLAVSLLQ